MKPPPSAVVALSFGTLIAAAVPEAVAQLPSDAKGLYERGCAPCHGVDGRGVEPNKVAFKVELPDFTDCRFASRESLDDWFAVAHQGGPVRAFDRTMPAFGDAFTDEQLELIVEYLRGFCTDDRWPRGQLNLPRALITEKAFPEDEFVYTVDVATEGPGEVTGKAVYERRFGPGSMFEVELPVAAVKRTSDKDDSGRGRGWKAGIGDIAVAVKHTLAHGSDSIFSVGGEVIFPSGSERHDLGDGRVRFEPYLAFGHLLPGSLFVQAQGGAELSTDRSKAQHEAFWRAVLGGTWSQGRFGRTWTPMLEMLGSVELEEGAVPEWSLVPQLQASLSRRQHILANIGVSLPINRTAERDTKVIFYILWDWFDGGFFQGW